MYDDNNDNNLNNDLYNHCNLQEQITHYEILRKLNFCIASSNKVLLTLKQNIEIKFEEFEKLSKSIKSNIENGSIIYAEKELDLLEKIVFDIRKNVY